MKFKLLFVVCIFIGLLSCDDRPSLSEFRLFHLINYLNEEEPYGGASITNSEINVYIPNNDSSEPACDYTFDLTAVEVQDFRDMVGNFDIKYNGEGSFLKGAVIIIDSVVGIYRPNSCSTCNSISSEKFCEVQTSLKILLEKKGVAFNADFSECDQDIVNELFECK